MLDAYGISACGLSAKWSFAACQSSAITMLLDRNPVKAVPCEASRPAHRARLVRTILPMSDKGKGLGSVLGQSSLLMQNQERIRTSFVLRVRPVTHYLPTKLRQAQLPHQQHDHVHVQGGNVDRRPALAEPTARQAARGLMPLLIARGDPRRSPASYPDPKPAR